MDYAADVAAIDAHPECYGRDDYIDFFGGEAVLGGAALVGFHPGVIMGGADFSIIEIIRHRLGVFARDAVNDGGLAAMAREDLGHLRVHIAFGEHAIDEIGAI